MNSSVSNTGPLSNELRHRASVISAQLKSMLKEPRNTGELAHLGLERLRRIENTVALLDEDEFRVAFVGPIGIGKSSQVSILTKLFVGGQPQNRHALRQDSVLAIGAGGTTVCEVRIRAISKDSPNIELHVDPYTPEEMQEVIRSFAEDFYRDVHGHVSRGSGGEDLIPREIERVIRNMTSLPVSHGALADETAKAADPLVVLARAFSNADAFAADLIMRATLPARVETSWRWNFDVAGLRGLKTCFESINHGKHSTAMLPHSIALRVPNPLPELSLPFNVEIVDTRGLDGVVEAREDLLVRLRDARCLVVSCSKFAEAPSEQQKAILKTLAADATLRAVASRMLLLLVDQDDAAQVAEADGNREIGQRLKKLECLRGLRNARLDEQLAADSVLVFDALQDDRKGLVREIERRLQQIRQQWCDTLKEDLADAESFLARMSNVHVARLRSEVDARLVEVEAHVALAGAPLMDSLAGFYEVIRECRSGSRVYASVRRRGKYTHLDAYAAIESGARKAATAWWAEREKQLTLELTRLETNPDFFEVREHIRLCRKELNDVLIKRVEDYAKAVVTEVRKFLMQASVWSSCEKEYGRGSRFNERVIQLLASWDGHVALAAYRIPDNAALLPPRPVMIDTSLTVAPQKVIPTSQTPKAVVHVQEPGRQVPVALAGFVICVCGNRMPRSSLAKHEKSGRCRPK